MYILFVVEGGPLDVKRKTRRMTNSEQALRAGLRTQIKSMQIAQPRVRERELAKLRDLQALGLRAPSGSLIGCMDAARVLDAFSKGVTAHMVRSCFRRPVPSDVIDALPIVESVYPEDSETPQIKTKGPRKNKKTSQRAIVDAQTPTTAAMMATASRNNHGCDDGNYDVRLSSDSCAAATTTTTTTTTATATANTTIIAHPTTASATARIVLPEYRYATHFSSPLPSFSAEASKRTPVYSSALHYLDGMEHQRIRSKHMGKSTATAATTTMPKTTRMTPGTRLFALSASTSQIPVVSRGRALSSPSLLSASASPESSSVASSRAFLFKKRSSRTGSADIGAAGSNIAYADDDANGPTLPIKACADDIFPFSIGQCFADVHSTRLPAYFPHGSTRHEDYVNFGFLPRQ